MKIDVRKNAKKGIAYGLVNRMVTLVLPFLVQTATIRCLGMEYVSIRGLFSSILSVLSLSELGIGTSIVYNMYKPIAEDDLETIGNLLNTYRILYRIIGLVILLIGIIIMPFLKLFMHGDYPQNINLYIVFALYLINTVISYWMFSYKASLLEAYQRSDVISFVGIFIQSLTCIIQIVFILLLKNFYVFLLIQILFTIINNLVISFCVDRMYPEIKCQGSISFSLRNSIRKNTFGLMLDKICGITRNSFDVIFITYFIGWNQSAMYSNYYMILTALNGFTGVVLISLYGGIGNTVAIEDKETNYSNMMNLQIVYLLFSGWIAVCMICLYQPFMLMWAGEKYIFSRSIMMLFPLYFLVLKLGDIRSVYSDAAGLFWENRVRIIIETIANPILNVLFVIKFGVFGIILATIITLFFIGFIGSTIVVFKYYYVNGMRKYISTSLYYFGVSIVLGIISYYICEYMIVESLVLSFTIRCVICISFVPLSFCLLCFPRRDFKEALKFIRTK